MSRAKSTLPGRRETPVPTMIAFRLQADAAQTLAERAERLGVSPHELARHYVLEVLHEPYERAALHEAVSSLHVEIHKVRGDVATAAEGLLVAGGKVSAEDARDWITENFK